MSHRITSRLNLIVLPLLVVLLLPFGARAAEKKEDRIEKAFDLYWGQRRDVKVIQKRLFRKEGRWEFTPFFGVTPNDEFWTYLPVGARIGYFLDEDLSIELNGAYVPSVQSDLKDFLQSNGLLDVDLPQRLEWYAGVNGLWAPIHGKFGIFTTKMSHFDMFLAFGAGAMGTKLFKRDQFDKRQIDIQGNLGLGFRFFILDWLALRLEYRHYLYLAAGGGVSFPAEISLGVSFFTAAPK